VLGTRFTFAITAGADQELPPSVDLEINMLAVEAPQVPDERQRIQETYTCRF
jgi:hypothetical protein